MVESLFRANRIYSYTVGEILVTTDMVGIYPNISHIEGLEVLRKQLS